jgi:chromosome segregation ATPase
VLRAEPEPEPEPRRGPGPDEVARQAALREATMAVTAAQDAAQYAEGAALAAEQHRDTLLRRARIAQDRLEGAHAQVAELESRLTAARAAASTAAAAWAPLHAEADAASARADAARGLAGSARAMLASARAHLADVGEADDGSTH